MELRDKAGALDLLAEMIADKVAERMAGRIAPANEAALLDLDGVADLLGITREAARKRFDREQLPIVRVGKRRFADRAKLQKLLDEGQV